VSSVELAKFCRLYGKPAGAFLFEPEEEPVLQRFRAVSVEETDHAVIQEAFEWSRYYAWLEQAAFGSQRYELPVYPMPRGRAIDQGEYLARQERRRLGLDSSAVPSLVDLLEDEGVKVGLRHFPPGSQVSGSYFFSPDLGPCVVINRAEPPSRRRFTAAHEYAHFLVDRNDNAGEVCAHSRRKELPEMRANAFAAAFLLPTDGVRSLLLDSDSERAGVGEEHVVHLAQHFGASYEAVLWRLRNLRLIDQVRHQSLQSFDFVTLARALGYSQEPGSSETTPDRFRTVAIEAWRNGEISLGKLAELLETPKRDLTRLLARTEIAKPRPSHAPAAEPDWL
jgi:Zn-dependent peptidase ImmA (M78 family)